MKGKVKNRNIFNVRLDLSLKKLLSRWQKNIPEAYQITQHANSKFNCQWVTDTLSNCCPNRVLDQSNLSESLPWGVDSDIAFQLSNFLEEIPCQNIMQKSHHIHWCMIKMILAKYFQRLDDIYTCHCLPLDEPLSSNCLHLPMKRFARVIT